MVGQMARLRDSSASVSSRTRQNHDPCLTPVCAKALERHFREAAAGVLRHQCSEIRETGKTLASKIAVITYILKVHKTQK